MSDPKDVLAVVGWYWRDWRASKARAVMSPLARGIYRELLDAHYAEPDGCLPDDDNTLAALAGVTPKMWAKVKDEVLPWLPLTGPGKRQNPRVGLEITKALAYRSACRAGGKATAAKRWGGGSHPTDQQPAGDSQATAGQPHSFTLHPSPSHKSESISSPAAPQAPGGAGGYSVHPDLEPQTGQPTGRSPRPDHPPLPRSTRKRPAMDVTPVIEAWNRIAAETGLPVVKGGGQIDAKIRPMLREEPDVAVIERALRLFADQPYIRENRYSLGNFLPNRGKYLPRARAGDDGGAASAASNPFLRAVE